MANRAKTSVPGPKMINAVSEMLRKLEDISADPSIVGSCPELPGIVLDKVEASVLDRNGPEYAGVTREYERLRADVGRGLALIAVGREGVERCQLTCDGIRLRNGFTASL